MYIHNKKKKKIPAVTSVRPLNLASNPFPKNQTTLRLIQEGLYPEPHAFKGLALILLPGLPMG